LHGPQRYEYVQGGIVVADERMRALAIFSLC
jgi:hypothetical protein